MINPLDSIKYRSVISGRYSFHFSDMEEAINEFMTAVQKTGATIKGNLLYALHNVPLDEIMNVEFFISVEDDYVKVPEEMFFHSYFSVENMASICVYGDFDKNTEVGYTMLLQFLEENGLEQATPMFHVFSGDEELPYVYLKVGYKEINNSNVFK